MSTTPETVLLVHGTGAARDAGRGDSWWQNGSPFTTWLLQKLPHLRLPADEDVFHWSGENSELQRREAGRLLLDRLGAREREGSPYHLVGHSHGGSVIWAALCEAERRGQALPGLRTWITVGTPYLHFGPAPFHWAKLLPGLAAVLGLWATWHHLTDYLRHAGAIRADAGLAVAGTPALLWLLLVLVLLYATLYAARAVEARRVCRRERRDADRAWRRWGGRYLPLWSAQDEAIHGLMHTRLLTGDITPRLSPDAGWWSVPPFRYVAGPVLRLYNRVIARSGDEFIWSRVTDGAQGNDLTERALRAVTAAPRGEPAPPVPPEVDAQLIDRANRSASATLTRIRRLLAGEAHAGDGLPHFAAQVQQAFEWQELIHTTYFDNEPVCECIRAHLAGAPEGAAANATAAPPPGRTVQEPARRTTLVRATAAVFTGVVGLLGMGLNLSATQIVGPYTADYQVRQIVSQADVVRSEDTSDDEAGALLYLRQVGSLVGEDVVLSQIRRLSGERRPAAIAAYAAGHFREGDTASARRLWESALALADSFARQAGTALVDSGFLLQMQLPVLREAGLAGDTAWAEPRLPALAALLPRVNSTSPETHDRLRALLAGAALALRPPGPALRLLRQAERDSALWRGLAYEFAGRVMRSEGAAALATFRRIGFTPPADAVRALAVASANERMWDQAVGLAASPEAAFGHPMEGECVLSVGGTWDPVPLCVELVMSAAPDNQIPALVAAARRSPLGAALDDFLVADSVHREQAARLDSVAWLAAPARVPEGYPRLMLRAMLAWSAARQGHPELARQLAGRLGTEEFQRYASGQLALEFAERGNVRHALEWGQAENPEFPTSQDFYYQLATLAVRAGRGQAFQRAADEMMTNELEWRWAHLALAVALADADEYRAARLVVDGARSLDSNEVLLAYTRILNRYHETNESRRGARR